MSTRAWYEYHVLDPVSRRRSRAMQFYKWGDATPEQALDEYGLIKHQVDQAEGLLPVIWLDDLLRDQLGKLYDRLPSHFPTAAFLFLIQRAREERSPFRNWDYHDLPKDERPDYRLGFAIGKDLFVELEDRPDKDADQARYDRQQADALSTEIRKEGIDIFSLDQAKAELESETDTFWGPHHHERPPLPSTLISDAPI